MLLDKERWLKGIVDEEVRTMVEEVLFKIEQALIEYQPVLTPFYERDSILLLKDRLKGVEEVKIISHGGYKDARRERLELRPLHYLPPLSQEPVKILEIIGESLKGKRHLYHSLHSLGLEEGSLGDLLTVERGFQLVVVPAMVHLLKKELPQKYGGSLIVNEIDSLQMEKGEEEGREFPTTVASMRLDAIASSGFGTSRNRMQREIVKEKLKVNWKIERDPSCVIHEDDVISMEGRGRLEIMGIQGESRRGRVKLLLKRYS